MISLVVLISILLFSFLPMVGAYVGIIQVVNGTKNKWQKDFSDAYLIRGGK
jgi:hypothetical protein